MNTAKRGFSPSIEDVRQYNIKRQRILSDFDNLSIDQNHAQHRSHKHQQPQSTRHTEYIPDIEEFLVNNQDDDDVLESSKHIGIDDPQSEWIIPKKITGLPNLSSEDVKFSFDRVQSRKKFEMMLKNFQKNPRADITNDEILHDYEILKFWSLLRSKGYSNLVWKAWENWYFNEYKLGEFSKELEDRIEMLPDDYAGPVDLDNREDNDIMIDDEEMINELNKESTPINEYGDYYGNFGGSSDRNQTQLEDAPAVENDDDAMDID